MCAEHGLRSTKPHEKSRTKPTVRYAKLLARILILRRVNTLDSSVGPRGNRRHGGNRFLQDLRLDLCLFRLNQKCRPAKHVISIAGVQDETPIKDGKVSGDAISFTADRPFGTFTYKGKISGDEIKLAVQFSDNSFEITAKRLK